MENTCFCRREGNLLTFGNSRIQRTLDLTDGIIRTLSVTDGKGTVFAGKTECDSDFQFYGVRLPEAERHFTLSDVSSEILPADVFDSEKMVVRLTRTEQESGAKIVREYFVYEGLPVIGIRSRVTCSVIPNMFWTSRRDLLKYQDSAWRDLRRLDPVLDILHLPESFSLRKAVEFFGFTDRNDDQVLEHPLPASGEVEVRGNLLRCSAPSGEGVFILQEAPPSSESREIADYDFHLSGNEVASCGWGIHLAEIMLDQEMVSCRHAEGFFSSPEEADLLLKEYLRRRFESRPLPLTETVNPWGCGSFPKRISEQFLLDEIRAAGECGASHYQIDDSWQTGGSLRELTQVNRKLDAEYWSISPNLFGGTFAPLLEEAAKSGVELSLWLAPSRNLHYRDHRFFTELLLRLHRDFGFRIFKIDAMFIRTYEAEQNLRIMLEEAVKESGNAISFNLDVTAEQRGGYFMFPEYGNLFLENRYVCHDWGMRYQPERTLRNLWRLTQYMRCQKLQIECASLLDLNRKNYEVHQDLTPDHYPWEYRLAIPFFANMLLWFAPSTITAEERASVRKMVRLHQQYADRILRGTVRVLGREPDGKSITGFHLVNPDEGDMILLFREWGCPDNGFVLPAGNWRKVAGEGTVHPGFVQFDAAPEFVLLDAGKA